MSTSSATQDVVSSVDPKKPSPQEVKYGSDLPGRCLAAYWKDRNALIDDHSRIKAVAKVLADEIRNWAPPMGQAKICYLAINEVADRLLRDTHAL